MPFSSKGVEARNKLCIHECPTWQTRKGSSLLTIVDRVNMILFTTDRLTGELISSYLVKNTTASHHKAFIMAETLNIFSH